MIVDREDVVKRTIAIIAEVTETDPSIITLESTFPLRGIDISGLYQSPDTEMDMDSLDRATTVSELEEEFDIEIDGDEENLFHTAAELVHLIITKLEAQPEPELESNFKPNWWQNILFAFGLWSSADRPTLYSSNTKCQSKDEINSHMSKKGM